MKNALDRLATTRALPKIHVLSDIHLESGPYEMPADLDCDIVVAAGDIGPLEHSVPWLASLGKPVVYVLGNHEYYGRDIDTAVAQAKALAQGTAVHILERESLVLNGVRFLGVTMWTSYGDWSAALAGEAYRKMNDYRYIGAGSWFSTLARKKAFTQLCRRAGLCSSDKKVEIPSNFHPAIGFSLHKSSVAWLTTVLKSRMGLPTVVVTHHSPVFESLKAKNVAPELLQPSMWGRRYRDDKLVYVAAYASDLKPLLRAHADHIDLWVHGHIHEAQDLLVEGVRVLSNPRGRYIAPLTTESAKGYALFGINMTQEDVDRSQAMAVQNPYRGDAFEFDSSLVLRLEDGFERPLAMALAPFRDKLSMLIESVKPYVPYAFKGAPAQRQATQRCIQEDIRAFSDVLDELNVSVLKQVDDHAGSGLESLNGRPGQPYLPWSDDEICPDHYAKGLLCMASWLAYLDSFPRCARANRAEWAAQACRALNFLKAKGIDARVVRPSVKHFRSVEGRDIRVVVHSAISEDTCSALEQDLDELINGRPPRRWYISVRNTSTDWYDKPIKNMLGLKDLDSFGQGLLVEMPPRDAQLTPDW